MSIKVRTTVRAHDATRTKQRRDLIVSILDNPCSLTASCFGWTNLVGEFTRGITLLRPNWYPAGRLFHGVEFRDDPTGGDGLPSKNVGLTCIIASEGKGCDDIVVVPLAGGGDRVPRATPPSARELVFLASCGPMRTFSSCPAFETPPPSHVFFCFFVHLFILSEITQKVNSCMVTDFLSIALDLARSMAWPCPLNLSTSEEMIGGGREWKIRIQLALNLSNPSGVCVLLSNLFKAT